MRCTHNLCYNGKTCCLASLQQQLQALGAQALEVIGRCTWFERTTAQNICTRCLHRMGYCQNLLLALNRARPRHDGKVTSTNLHLVLAATGNNHCIIGVEATVCALERIGNARNAVNYLKPCKQVNVNLAGIANETEHGLHLTLGNVNPHVLRLKPMDKVIALSLCYSVFKYCYHSFLFFLFLNR